MTLVIAIKYKDGILIGSDSQATLNRGVPLKKLNQVKLFELKNLKYPVVIGGAGAVPFISKSIEEIQSNIKKDNKISFSEVISIAEKAVLHVSRWYSFDRVAEIMPKKPIDKDLVQFIPPIPPREDESKRDVIKHESAQPQIEIKPVDVILIIAGFDENNESQIYIVYPDGIGEKQQSEAAIGSGAAYAEYILSQLIFKDMGDKEALKIITQAINEVKKMDPGVGGFPQVMKIQNNKVTSYEEKAIMKVGQQVQQIQDHVQNVWHDYITGKIKFKEEKRETQITDKNS
ncbi:hypothetical protein HYV80_01605 [Candidatus Woesearchaeota archaeon]|nr:hypothetical protein [Candidatus Woesearchaeota archaeon]